MLDKIQAIAKEAKKRRGRPPGPKNMASLSTVQSQSMINQPQEKLHPNELQEMIQKKSLVRKRQYEKKGKSKSLERQHSDIDIKNYPYLQELLQHTRDQDIQFILMPDFNAKEQLHFKKGLAKVIELVQNFKLSESTALIGVFLLRKFFNHICISYSAKSKKGNKASTSQKSKSTAERSSSGYYNKELDEQSIQYYSQVAFYLAAKYNEIQWPDLKEIIGEDFDIKVYLVRECEVLEAVNYQIPYPNHYLYLETALLLLNLKTDIQQKIRVSFQSQLLKLNFFAICPRQLVIYSVLILLQFDQNFEQNIKKLSEYFDFPVSMLKNLRILHSVFIN